MKYADAYELDHIGEVGTQPLVPSDAMRNMLYNSLRERRAESGESEVSIVDSEFSPFLQTRMDSTQRSERAGRLHEIHRQRERAIAEGAGVSVRDYTPTPALSFQRGDFKTRTKRRATIRTGGLGAMPWVSEESK